MNYVRKRIRTLKRRRTCILVMSTMYIHICVIMYAYTLHQYCPVFPGVYLSEKCDPIRSGVITTLEGGRLGNMIFEYISVLTFAQLYGLQVYVPPRMTRGLELLFESRMLPKIKVNFSHCQWEYDDKFEDVTWEMLQLKRVATLDDVVQIARKCRRAIVLSRYIILVETVAQFVGEFKVQFRYKREYEESARRTLTDIRAAMGKEVLFVGVHVRRTDYIEHYRLSYNGTAMAGADYFRRAATWMRAELDRDARRPVTVAFVVTGDDHRWCAEELVPSLRDADRVHKHQVFHGGTGDVENPEHDLVLLSLCNHSIIDYGTFGMWAAFMAGGRTVVYNVTSRGDNARYSPAMRFAGYLAKWVVMH